MNRHQTLATGGIVLLGLLLVLTIIFGPGSSSASAEETESERGPHGGLVLEGEGGRTLEVTIYEAGVPPEWRLYPMTGGQPADHATISLAGEVHRLGGIVDTVAFNSVGAFLRGDKVVYEPHSFDVVVHGTWDDLPVRGPGQVSRGAWKCHRPERRQAESQKPLRTRPPSYPL